MTTSETYYLKLPHDLETVIDAEDFPKTVGYEWRAKWNKSTKTYYVLAQWRDGIRGQAGRKRHCIQLHRLIMDLPIGDPRMVDHINSNGLDNRRSANLRIATNQQNCFNSRPKKNVSGFKGVTWHAPTKQWRARIGAGKRVHLGLFPTAELAHAAYCEAAAKYHGEFARTK